jgi:hypothetical protein
MYSEVLRPAGLDKDLVIPLPAPVGIARRLIFFRSPGKPFSDGECAAAILLQPHISEALRLHARLMAARLLTARQLELLRGRRRTVRAALSIRPWGPPHRGVRVIPIPVAPRIWTSHLRCRTGWSGEGPRPSTEM